jgi:hypothetical protein
MADNLSPDDPNQINTAGGDELAGYVMSRVKRWRQTRDQNYRDKWAKYYAVWRGEWTADLKGKQAERSKIITPATQQATDQTVAEMVEATFGRGDWMDIADVDQQVPPEVVQQVHDNLLADLELYRVQSAIVDTYYNGAIFGTGIAKRIIDKKTQYAYVPNNSGTMQDVPNKKYCVMWEAVPPYNFVIDTAATNIEDAHGVAHETTRPTHEIKAKQDSGEYYKGEIGVASNYTNTGALKMNAGLSAYETDPIDGVYITEYHGLAPKRLITGMSTADEPDMSDVAVDEPEQDGTDEELVESIITIANGSKTLKAVENPILGKSRGFVAYQHHKAPNRFWGIGQPEKAFNSQSALDSEVRARLDTLALCTYPVVTADATRLPKNLNLQIVPGKLFLTNGRGSEIIEPMKLGDVSGTNFQNAQDLERMVQMATGAEDPTKSINNNPRMEAASGASMAQAPYIKRAKLTMQNVDTDFLGPLAKKTIEAYMTFDPDRYPVMYNYVVKSSVSIMAREFEQAQMTNLLSVLPDGSPAHNIVLKGIIENYSGPSKESMMKAVDAMNNPDPQQQQMQQMQQQLQMQTLQATLAKLQAEVTNLQTKSAVNQSQIAVNKSKAQTQGQQVAIQAAQTHIEAKKTDIQAAQLHQQSHSDKMNAAVKLHTAHVQAQTARMKPKPNGPNT